MLLITLLAACQPKSTVETAQAEAVDRPRDTLSVAGANTKNRAVIPKSWAVEQFRNLKLDTLYLPANFTSPTFLEGDFNGDKMMDIAFLVSNRNTKEKGILILHKGKPTEFYVFGAGTEVEEMTDLNWIEIFEKIPVGETVAKTLVDEETGDIIGPDSLNAVVLKSEGIFTHLAEECGGGILYWDKNKYHWLHVE